MKIRDNDVFFTVDVPVLRIRPCTPAEAAARPNVGTGPEPASSGVGWRPQRRPSTVPAGRLASAAGQDAEPEPLPPWREVAAAWRHVCATYDGLFLSEEEEEQARVAFHRGGARWRIFRMELAERKRDREIEAQHGRHEAAPPHKARQELRLVGLICLPARQSA